METLVALNMIGYALAVGGGIVLGTMFGRMVLKDLLAAAHAVEGRLSALEASLHHHSASPDHSHHSVAIEKHAAATEKLAAAIQSHAESANRPLPAAH